MVWTLAGPRRNRDVLQGHAGQQQLRRERVAQAVAAEFGYLGLLADGGEALGPELRGRHRLRLAGPEVVRPFAGHGREGLDHHVGEVHLDEFPGLAPAQREQRAFKPLAGQRGRVLDGQPRIAPEQHERPDAARNRTGGQHERPPFRQRERQGRPGVVPRRPQPLRRRGGQPALVDREPEERLEFGKPEAVGAGRARPAVPPGPPRRGIPVLEFGLAFRLRFREPPPEHGEVAVQRRLAEGAGPQVLQERLLRNGQLHAAASPASGSGSGRPPGKRRYSVSGLIPSRRAIADRVRLPSRSRLFAARTFSWLSKKPAGPQRPLRRRDARLGPLAEQAALHLGHGRDDGHVGLARRRAGIAAFGQGAQFHAPVPPLLGQPQQVRHRPAQTVKAPADQRVPLEERPSCLPEPAALPAPGNPPAGGRSRRPPCAAAGTLVLAPPRLANFARNGGFGADRGRTFGFRNEPRNAHARPSALLLDCGLWILLRSC